MISSVSTNHSIESPKVAAVILNWNGGEMVCDTVRSVLDQSPSVAYVVVVDNASVDGSDDALEAQFPQVKIVRNSGNLGFAAGNNVGIRLALELGADYVLLLNSDAELETLAVQTMAADLARDRRWGMVVPKIYFYPSSTDSRLWAAGAEWKHFPPRVKMRGNGNRDVGQYDKAEVVKYATGCALLIRREVFDRVGLLDESYFMYHEDYEFCDRVRSKGLLTWYEPRAIVYHRVSASVGEGSHRKWFHWGNGAVLFYMQHYGDKCRGVLGLTAFLLWVVGRELAHGRTAWRTSLFHGVRVGWNSLRRVDSHVKRRSKK